MTVPALEVETGQTGKRQSGKASTIEAEMATKLSTTRSRTRGAMSLVANIVHAVALPEGFRQLWRKVCTGGGTLYTIDHTGSSPPRTRTISAIRKSFINPGTS